jgi:acyl-CoA carboxylase epsilon subunit-like protein
MAIRVVRGEPTEEELAALLVVLLTRPAVPAPVPARRRASWARGGFWVAHSWRSSELDRG